MQIYNSCAWNKFNEATNIQFYIEEENTWVAKTRSSPTAKKARKAYMLLKQKALKQNTAPINVVTERSCNNWQVKNLVAEASWNNFDVVIQKK